MRQIICSFIAKLYRGQKTIREKWLDNYFRSIRPIDVLSYTNFFLYAEVPTVQGCHLITLPFDSLKFSEAFPNVDVHKNSMGTLLYYPKSLEK